MDSLLEKIGGFGKFQKRVLVVICLYSSLAALVTYSPVFNNARPEFQCYHEEDSSTFLNATENCKAWEDINQNQQNSSYSCQYNKTYYGESIVTEWNLICDDQKLHFPSLTTTVFMIGALCSFFSGYFSDRFGRRTVVMFVHILLSVSLVLCEALQMEIFGLSEDAKSSVYLVTQFMLGFTSFIVYVVSYILLMEVTSPKYSMTATVIMINCYCLGEILLLIVSYFFRNWHYQVTFAGAYSIFILVVAGLILPESPKFLIANKRFEEAADILTKISETNGSSLAITASDIKFELNSHVSDSGKKLLPTTEEGEKRRVEKLNKETSMFYYLTHPVTNLVKSVALAYLFVAMSMIYFGVSLGITTISSTFDPYVMYLLSAFAEMIGYSMGKLDRKVSRKAIMCVTLFLAGGLCLFVAIIPVDSNNPFSLNSILVASSAIVGKIMCSAAFNIIYLYAAQFFPTGVRNTMVSYVTCAGRIGSFISPQINFLGTSVWKPLPYIVFSTNAFLSSIIIFFMPDTASLKHDV